MADFVPEKNKLSELLRKIDEGKIQLPNFQRDYKWKPSKVIKLLDSIQSGYPAGSLLFLEVDISNPLLLYRPFEFVEIEDIKPEILVLDGQQRLTSCYYAFYNSSSKQDKTYYLKYKKLYTDYYRKGISDCDFEDLITVKKHDSVPEADCRAECLLNLSYIKTREQFIEAKKNIAKNIDDEDFKSFITYDIDNYFEELFNYEFPVVKLSKEMSVEAVCKIFETINTTGLKLSSFDICVAKFMRDDLDLRKKMNEIQKDSVLSTILNGNENLFLQAIALLANKPPKANALANNLKSSDIIENWDITESGFEFIIDLLDEIGVGLKKNTSILPYKPILPLFSALAIKCNIITASIEDRANFIEKITKFFYTTAFSARYTEGTDSKIQKDFYSLYDWIKKDTVPDVINRGIEWNTENRLKNSDDSAFGKAVLCLINSNSPKDFYNSYTVGIGPSLIESQILHLFPKARYKNQFKEERLNSVFNLTFISKDTNVFINDGRTKDYIQNILKGRGTTEIAFVNLLKGHLIDEKCYEYLMAEDFDKFIKARAELIKEKLKIMGLNVKEVDKSEDIYSDFE